MIFVNYDYSVDHSVIFCLFTFQTVCLVVPQVTVVALTLVPIIEPGDMGLTILMCKFGLNNSTRLELDIFRFNIYLLQNITT